MDLPKVLRIIVGNYIGHHNVNSMINRGAPLWTVQQLHSLFTPWNGHPWTPRDVDLLCGRRRTDIVIWAIREGIADGSSFIHMTRRPLIVEELTRSAPMFTALVEKHGNTLYNVIAQVAGSIADLDRLETEIISAACRCEDLRIIDLIFNSMRVTRRYEFISIALAAGNLKMAIHLMSLLPNDQYCQEWKDIQASSIMYHASICGPVALEWAISAKIMRHGNMLRDRDVDTIIRYHSERSIEWIIDNEFTAPHLWDITDIIANMVVLYNRRMWRVARKLWVASRITYDDACYLEPLFSRLRCCAHCDHDYPLMSTVYDNIYNVIRENTNKQIRRRELGWWRGIKESYEQCGELLSVKELRVPRATSSNCEHKHKCKTQTRRRKHKHKRKHKKPRAHKYRYSLECNL